MPSTTALPPRVMTTLPKGTVAFLFTDIEGSARLWEENSETMPAAMARHDALVGDAVASFGGVVFKSIGDGVRAVFESPRGALLAALHAQASLAAEEWPTDSPVRVRMAVHCGTTAWSDGDYVGQTLNRCSRIEDLAHGGQVLVSQAVYALTRDDLPETMALEDLGEHPLRDLSRPERLYQLQHPELTATFPPLRSLERVPNNLPARLSSFVGREEQVEQVGRLLRSWRLVSLLGPGGTGKTRLALQVAADLMVHWPDGTWLIDLAPLGDPARVYPAVAEAVRVVEEQGRPLEATIVDALRERRMLLILDNCEHLVLECAQVVDQILASCAGVTVLATTREALGLEGEVCHRVPPMAVPPAGVVASREAVARNEAVQLFVDRAQRAEPGFALSDENAGAVADICRRLDGIPLALELAAARSPGLSPLQIGERLDQRFQLLTGGSRIALPRQQTLRAAIDWSYDLLDRREQAVLARLAVFASRCTLEAAEAVCAGEGIALEDVMDLVLQLGAKSLVSVDHSPRGARYGLTQTMRDYARDRLLRSGETEVVRDRHLAHYLDVVERMERLPDDPDLAERLALLDLEHDDVRAALRWAWARGNATAGLRIAASMARYWTIRGHWTEGHSQLERAACGPDDGVEPRLRADVLTARASLAMHQGDADAAQTDYQQALAIYSALNDAKGMAATHNGLGNLAFGHGRPAEAEALYKKSLALARTVGDAQFAAGVLGNLGNVAQRRLDLETAKARHAESLAIRRRLGDRRGTASALVNLGNVAYHQGRWSDARACHEESLAIRRALGDQSGTATSLHNLCTALAKLGDLDAAHACASESLAINRSLADPVGIAYSLSSLAEVELSQGESGLAASRLAESLRTGHEIGDPRIVSAALLCLAAIAAESGDPPLAARLLSAAEARYARTGMPPMPASSRQEEEILGRCRDAMSPDDLEAAREAGRALEPDAAVSIAEQLAAAAGERAPAVAAGDPSRGGK